MTAVTAAAPAPARGEPATVDERWRLLHRRGRAARFRRWLAAVSVSGGALVLVTVALLSLISH